MRLAPFLALFLTACATVPPAADRRRARRSAGGGTSSTLAADDMEGRLTGTPGYQRAADYVVSQLRAIGLEPAGTDGYFQPVAFEEQFVVAAGSSAALVAGGRSTSLSIPGDIIIGRGDGRRPGADRGAPGLRRLRPPHARGRP